MTDKTGFDLAFRPTLSKTYDPSTVLHPSAFPGTEIYGFCTVNASKSINNPMISSESDLDVHKLCSSDMKTSVSFHESATVYSSIYSADLVQLVVLRINNPAA